MTLYFICRVCTRPVFTLRWRFPIKTFGNDDLFFVRYNLTYNDQIASQALAMTTKQSAAMPLYFTFPLSWALPILPLQGGGEMGITAFFMSGTT